MVEVWIRVFYCDSTFRAIANEGAVMPLQDYWANLTQQRVSRRRGLKLGSGLGLGALALSMIGCGGGSDSSKKSSSSSPKTSDIVAEPKDTAKEGKAGGVWKHFA